MKNTNQLIGCCGLDTCADLTLQKPIINKKKELNDAEH